MDDNIYTELADLKRQVAELSGEVRSIRTALLGSDFDRVGITQLVADVSRGLAETRDELRVIRADQVSRHASRSSRRWAAIALLPVAVILAWVLATFVMAEYRSALAITSGEARIGITALVFVLTVMGGWVSQAVAGWDV